MYVLREYHPLHPFIGLYNYIIITGRGRKEVGGGVVRSWTLAVAKKKKKILDS
jgi:hypothetical protein